MLTKGIPIRVKSSSAFPSVECSLAALDYTNLPGAVKISVNGDGAMGYAFSNRYWNATEPFSHSRFGGYLVTRLDGYTEADAKALVRRALAAERGLTNGKVLLDVQPSFGLGDKAAQPAPITVTEISKESPWSEFNADMRGAHDILAKRGIPDELDLSETFVGGRSNLLGYFSWGSNDARFPSDAYQTLFFAPGSLSDTAVSTSARTFLPTTGRTNAAGRFDRSRAYLRKGVCGRAPPASNCFSHHRFGSLYLRIHHGGELLCGLSFHRLGGCGHWRSALLPLSRERIGPAKLIRKKDG